MRISMLAAVTTGAVIALAAPLQAQNEAVLRQANLGKTTFTDSDFQGANLLEADMSGANFTHVRFEKANLRDTKQDGTILTGSLMPDGSTAP